MVKDSLTKLCGKADAGFCRKVLGSNTEGKTYSRQKNHIKDILNNETFVLGGNADVDDSCHNERRDQIHERFCHLKGRGKEGFFFVSIDISN